MECLQYVQNIVTTCRVAGVLNLIITGIPSIHRLSQDIIDSFDVLNLIITGMPSIP